jgi:hypothetical protein
VILVDGGDNQLFARYLAARFPDSSNDEPRKIDCILVTHGDADHFSGLVEIFESEKNRTRNKRLFLAPERIYHNGIVKRPGNYPDGKKRPDRELLGPVTKVNGNTILTGLVENLLEVPDQDMNREFLKWKKTIAAWIERRTVTFRRLSFGQDDAFDFIRNPELEFSVLGPIICSENGISGLKFLGNPPKGPKIGHDSLDTHDGKFTGLSASHTINGHSVIFKLRYKGFSCLFTGDLNDESGRALSRKQAAGEIDLRSEIFKVTHHGSADFSGEFIRAVSPVVSVVSSGDETIQKEYIHPRATLMGALGRYSRFEESLVFVTELVAFFKLEGWSRLKDTKKNAERGEFFAFSRAIYGIVKTRTDGTRMLVYTDSGKMDLKEAYCCSLDAAGQPVPAAIIHV